MAKRKDDGFYHWFAGLMDGEGWFTLFRPRGRTVYHPRCGIGMRADEEPMLQLIRFRVGVGNIHYKKARILTSQETGVQYLGNPGVVWEVTSLKEQGVIVDILDRHPLRSRKRQVYEVWRAVVLDKLANEQNPNHVGTKAFAQTNQDVAMHAEAYGKLRLLHGYKLAGSQN